MAKLIPNSWVRLTKAARAWHVELQPKNNMLLEVDRVLFLGEITYSPGIGIFMNNHYGTLIAGLHMSDFEMIPEDEV